MNVTLIINGLETQACFKDEEVESLHKPLLKSLAEKQKALGRRLVVFLAAPPGTGEIYPGVILGISEFAG